MTAIPELVEELGDERHVILRLAIDPDRLYLFDPATNQALDP